MSYASPSPPAPPRRPPQSGYRHCPCVCLVDRSGTLPAPYLGRLAVALGDYVQYHVGPAWERECDVTVSRDGDLPPGCWGIVYYRDAGQAEPDWRAGGLMTVSAPIEAVFLSDALECGEDFAVEGSRRLAEMLCDPWCGIAHESNKHGRHGGEFWGRDVCSPVLPGVFECRGAKVANFVYRAWYEPDAATAGGATRFDHLGTLHQPFELAPGGYAMTWTGSKGWRAVLGDGGGQERFYQLGRHARPYKRQGGRMSKRG